MDTNPVAFAKGKIDGIHVDVIQVNVRRFENTKLCSVVEVYP